MLCNNHPAISYVSWFGLVIMVKDKKIEVKDDGSSVEVETETPYIISDSKSCMKYIYWDYDENPYVLKESNVWIKESTTRKMIYINENGTATEVPHDDISVYYNDTGNGGSSKLVGEALGKYDELNGKYMIVQEDVNGIKEVLGYEGQGTGGTLIERLNKVEKTAEGTTETIKTIEKDFANDRVMEVLRNNMNISIINVGEALLYLEDELDSMAKDLEVSTDEKTAITEKQNILNDAYAVLSSYHDQLIAKLEASEEDTSATVLKLNHALSALNDSITNLNRNVTTAISDNTIVPSELTTMLSLVANVALKNNEYKNTLSDAILLGVGGRLTESVLDIKKTSNSFSQTISDIEYEIDGETGLKVQIKDNKTAIQQNANEISLKCVKFNDTTSQLTVGDGFIKLDASKVLMTGTLTWDSLDDTAKNNLKGADGTAEYIMLVGDQIFKYDKDGNPNTNSITLTAQVSNIENPVFDWYYRDAKSSLDWNVISDNSGKSSFILTHDSSIWGDNTNSITIKVVCGSHSDEMTVVKLYDGLYGENAKYVSINGNQLFRYRDNFTSTPNPTSITLTGTRNNIPSTTTSRWYYRVSESDNWTEITSSRNLDILTINHDSSYFGDSKILMIRYEIETYYDIITIAKISDGSDGYFVLLTNENHSVPCDENGDYTYEAISTAYTYIRVYKGTEEKSFTLTKIDDGCESVYNSSTKRLDITVLSNNIATVTMTITVDNKTFQKVMTITKSIRGEKGEDGTGVNIIGKLDNVNQLPETGTPGDAYIIDGLIYVWSENINGWSDGVPFRGEQGLPGKDGTDGRTTYVHIKYSNDGKTFTSNNGEDVGDWLGQYTDYIAEDSTNFNDYKWKKIRGEDGDNGIVANLTNDTHIVPIESNGTFANDSFVGCSTKISLSFDGMEIVNNVIYGFTAQNDIKGTWDSKTGTYTVTGWDNTKNSSYVDLKATYNGVTYTKRFTIIKAKNPLDAYTVVLTNESHVFAGDVLNALPSNTTCGIIAYRGDKLVPVEVGEILNIPTGMDIAVNNNNTTSVTLSISVTTAMVTRHGTISIPIKIGLLSLTKTFTYAISLKGVQGEPGIPGKDGKDGNSVRVLGRYNTIEQLNQAHPNGNENGDGYIVDKDLWVWTDNKFINVGQFQGEDGVSTYVHIKYSNNGTSFTNNNGEDIGTWIGMYVDNTETDSLKFSDYKWKKMEGIDAKLLSLSANRQTIAFNNNNTPKDSTAIILTANQQNFSDTLTWTTVPNVTLKGNGNNRTLDVSNFINNNQILITVSGGGLTDTITIVKISDGQRGSDGTSVKILGSYNTIEQLNQAHPNGNENGDGYMVDKDLWVWNGIKFINVGQIKGNDGINGTNGKDGASAYIHIKYSNDGGKTFTSNNGEDAGNWLGQYTDNIKADSSNPSDYTWSRTKGNDGWDAYTVLLTNESHTFAGDKNGALTNSTTCGVIAYKGNTQVPSRIGNITGMPTGMTTSINNNNTNNASFIVAVNSSMTSRNGVLTVPITVDGVTFTKRFTYALSLNGSDGVNGTSAKLLSLSANKQVIAFNSNNTPKDSTGITLTATQQNFSGEVKWSTNPSVPLTGSGLTRSLAISNFNNNTRIAVTVSSGSLSDTITLVKVIDGTNGTDGTDGIDGYTINLSNDNHTFVANQDGKIETQQAITTTVVAYKGSTLITPTIGTLPTVNGLTISRSGTTITIIAPVGTNLATHGSFNIPVIVDGRTFNKAFSYSKVNAGKNAYTIILTNESHAFPCENNGNIPSAISTTTVVKAYKGTSEITPTIGNLPSVSGLTLSKSGTTITIQANAGTSLSASGKFDIPITVDGLKFTKSFSWAKAYKGNTGNPGTPGSNANVPSWIKEWDNGKTTINGSTVLSPKIFAGSVSNGKPTGVAIGKNVFGTSGTYANINGIVGYMNGNKSYSFSTDGKVNIGNSSNYLNWDGSTLTISGKVYITSGSSYNGTSFDTIRNGANLANSWVKNSTYIDGAKIYTGSITANQIQANAITADKIKADAINGKNIKGGTIDVGSGTFVVNSSGQIKARTVPNEKGQYLDISSSTYKIWRNSKCCMEIGFRDLTFENGNTVTGTPAIYMGADGINPYGGDSYTGETGRYYARWYTTDHNNSQSTSHANMPTMMFEFNTRYKNANTGRPIASQIKMYGDGDMRIAPAGALEIYTHKHNNAINADGDEELIAKFASSTSDYYPSRFEVSAVCNIKNSKGLRLADYYKSSAGNGYDGTDFMAMAEVRAGYYSNGNKLRTFRPHLDNAMELGSGSYRWKKVFSAVSTISTSDRRCKTNIEYLTAENKKVSTNCMTTKEEIWEFVKDIDYASYNFINGEGEADKDNQFGFILQDLLQSHPDLTTDLILDNSARNPVEGEDTGEAPLMGYNTGNYVNILGCALQQALQRIEVLENKLNDK